MQNIFVMLYFILTITPLLSVLYISIPRFFESLLYTPWLLQKACISTCFPYWEKIGRGIFPLHKKLKSSFSICFAGAFIEAAHSPVSESCCSVAQSLSHSVVSDSLWSHELQHTRLPWPLLSPWVCSNSCLVSDAIQPSPPLSPPLAFNLSQPFLLLCANGKRTLSVFKNPAELVSDQIIRLISIYQALNIPQKLF